MHGFVPTRAARQAHFFLESCRLTPPDVSLLAGAPGTGKSAVLAAYAQEVGLGRRGPLSVVQVSCVPGLGPVGLLQSLLDQVLPGYRAPGGRQGLARLGNACRSQGVQLVTLDDAHHLFKTPLQMLRALHERAGVSLVLAGPLGELRARLRQVPALLAHVHQVHALGLLRPDEVEAVASLRLRQDGAELAEALARESQGNFGRLLLLLEQCRLQARLQTQPPVSPALVDQAATRIGVPDDEAA